MFKFYGINKGLYGYHCDQIMEIFIYIVIFIATFAFWIISKPLRDFLSYFRKLRKSQQALKQFPSAPYHWLLGHLYKGGYPGPGHDGLIKFMEWTKQFPRCFVFHVGPIRSVLILNHPDTVKQLLKTAEPKAVLGGGGYKFIKPWIGDGLLLSSGEKWFRNRKLLTHGFHFDVLKPYMEVYNTCTDVMLGIILRNHANAKESFDIYRLVHLCALDIILRCAFSTERNVQSTEFGDDPYAMNVRNLAKAIIKRFTQPLHYIDGLYYKTEAGKQFKRECEFSHAFTSKVCVFIC